MTPEDVRALGLPTRLWQVMRQTLEEEEEEASEASTSQTSPSGQLARGWGWVGGELPGPGTVMPGSSPDKLKRTGAGTNHVR